MEILTDNKLFYTKVLNAGDNTIINLIWEDCRASLTCSLLNHESVHVKTIWQRDIGEEI